MKRAAPLALLLGLFALSAQADTLNVNIADFDRMSRSVESVTITYTFNNSSVTNRLTFTPSTTNSIVQGLTNLDTASLSAVIKPGYEKARFPYYAASLPGGQAFATGEISNGSTVPFHTDTGNSAISYTTFVTNLVVDPMKFNLSFDANGGTVSPASKTIVYDDAYGALPTPSRTGYIFSGWTGEGKTWTGEEIVNTLTNQTFTAEWTPITYTVTFGANGGTGTMSPQTFTYDAPQNLSANAFTRENYNFSCWTNAVTGLTYANGVQVSNLASEQNAVVALDAVWTAKQYSVCYHRNYGADTWTSDTIAYGEGVTLAGALVRTGYSFAGWAKTADARIANFEGGELISSKDLVFDENGVCDLYAVWNAKSYTVAFDPEGGTGTMNPVVRTFDDGVALPACTFANTGHRFSGWATFKGGAKVYDDGTTENLSTVENATVMLFAVWIPITYTIAFDKNDVRATNEMASVERTYGTVAALPLCTFGKDGYDFTGWATSSDGDAVHSDGAPVGNLSSVQDAVVTLFAKWKAQSYTVALDANGGAFTENGLAVSNITVTVDEAYGALPSPTNALPKFVFSEWRTLAGAPVTSENLVAPPSAGITNLVAHWVKDDPLARAVDAEQLDFNQKQVGGGGAWTEKKNVDGVGGDYAEASPAQTDYCSVIMQAEVVGPGELTFKWKIESPVLDIRDTAKDSWEYAYEHLSFGIGNSIPVTPLFGLVGSENTARRFTGFVGLVPSEMKSAETGWLSEKVRIDARAGETNTVSWTFTHQDGALGHAWVDAVHWVPDEGTVIYFR